LGELGVEGKTVKNMYLKEIGCNDVNFIHVAEDSVK